MSRSALRILTAKANKYDSEYSLVICGKHVTDETKDSAVARGRLLRTYEIYAISLTLYKLAHISAESNQGNTAWDVRNSPKIYT